LLLSISYRRTIEYKPLVVLKNKSPRSLGAREALLSGLFIIELYYTRIKFHATVVCNQFLTEVIEFIKTDAYFNHSKRPDMHTNPKENRILVDRILLEEFHRKGYKCEEVKEENATIFIITHQKKATDNIAQLINATYKELRKAN
jgi:hypothetical protein